MGEGSLLTIIPIISSLNAGPALGMLADDFRPSPLASDETQVRPTGSEMSCSSRSPEAPRVLSLQTCCQNRFHKWLRTAEGLAVGQRLPRPRGIFQLILHAVIARAEDR